MFHWDKIYTITELPVIKQTYFFVIVIPIVANLLSTVEGAVSKVFSFGSFSVTIPLFLPASWHLLFFSAICFLFARILCALFCPSIIAHEGNYILYRQTGKGFLGLDEYVRKYGGYFDKNDEFKAIKRKVTAKAQNVGSDCYYEYHSVRKTLNEYFPFIRYFAFSFLAFGFIMLAILVILKIQVVVKMI